MPIGYKAGQRTSKGTLVTESTVNSVAADDAANLIIAENNTKEVLKAIEDAKVRALEQIGLAAEGYAKRLCPVDTGRLRNSITHYVSTGEDAVYIGTNVPYGKVVEFGNSGTKYKGANDGRGYLRPAANDHMDDYRRLFENEMKK